MCESEREQLSIRLFLKLNQIQEESDESRGETANVSDADELRLSVTDVTGSW